MCESLCAQHTDIRKFVWRLRDVRVSSSEIYVGSANPSATRFRREKMDLAHGLRSERLSNLDILLLTLVRCLQIPSMRLAQPPLGGKQKRCRMPCCHKPARAPFVHRTWAIVSCKNALLLEVVATSRTEPLVVGIVRQNAPKHNEFSRGAPTRPLAPWRSWRKRCHWRGRWRRIRAAKVKARIDARKFRIRRLGAGVSLRRRRCCWPCARWHDPTNSRPKNRRCPRLQRQFRRRMSRPRNSRRHPHLPRLAPPA